MEKVKTIKELINQLNEASIVYYNSGNTTMSDEEFDIKYEELKQLEEETNIVFSNSPTHKVGSEVVNKLETVKHNHPMLSLDKCHSTEELIKFAGSNDCLLMLKMDGLTISLEYNNHKLISAETRGTGEEGSNVLHNVLVFKNVPKEIKYSGHLIIDGEAIITYQDFNKINETLTEDKKYKNPRNLASGSLTLLDNKDVAKRNLRFIAWKVIKGLEEVKSPDSNFCKLKELETLGFDVVPMWTYSNKSDDKDNISEMLSNLRVKAEELAYPIDGAVMLTDSILKGSNMGRTEKFFRHSIAYKFEDDDYTTILKDIEFTMGKTGVLTPTAIFDTVLIDGTEVSRASLHNISIAEDLELGIGDEITVYKANCIIPQLRDNLTRSNNISIPSECPICGGDTEIKQDKDSKVLICTNPNCKGKLLGRLAHFVSKKAMNIDGLSEATLMKFINLEYLENLHDIFIFPMRKEVITFDGFGKKSFNNLVTAIGKSQKTTLQRVIYSLSIPNVGSDASKKISKKCKGELEAFRYLISINFNWSSLDGIGNVINQSIQSYFNDMNNLFFFDRLLHFVEIAPENNVVSNSDNKSLDGISFVITGTINHFKNRDELKVNIESRNGKVVGSVSKNTNYLICNEISSSSKCKKAQSLGVKIIGENEFLEMIK